MLFDGTPMFAENEGGCGTRTAGLSTDSPDRDAIVADRVAAGVGPGVTCSGRASGTCQEFAPVSAAMALLAWPGASRPQLKR
jgi:hypothetical protein